MKYTYEDGCRAWLTYAYTQPAALQRMMDEFGTASAIYDRCRRDGGQSIRGFLTERNTQLLVRQSSRDMMHAMMVAMQRADMQVVAIGDSAYSPALRNIGDPPPFLFIKGDPACMTTRCLAVIGSRAATPLASTRCEDLCRNLSNRGVTIVSGLAAGIDTSAHEGSLRGTSPGIGVMACGLDVDYPVCSRELKERLLDHGGLLISEYPPGTPVRKSVFSARNRIISGLCKGVVMMEARITSGSFITVQHALDQGRDVFAWPGEPGSVWSEGAHQLLREGARYFVTAEDILEDLSWDDTEAIAEKNEPAMALTPAMQQILTILYGGEKSLDELAYESKLDISTLSTSLTILQMSGMIRALPGKMYCVV